MSPRYYQGTSVLGPVKASTARTFREVVDAFRVCPTLGITRAAFLAMDKKQRNEAKQVPFFVAATFKQSPSNRDYAHAKGQVCNLIFLDIDEQKDGKCPAAPFVNNPENLYTALVGYNFAAYTTASSTPAKPRIRVVVDADEIPIELYPRAVSTIGALLGLTVTSESRVSVQPMFLPTMFSDSGAGDEPLFAMEFDSKQFEVSDVSGSVEKPHSTKAPRVSDTGIDTLEFLRAPVPEITLAVAKEALSNIDPDVDYKDWLEVAAALKHQFSPHKVEEAYTLFDEWSSDGTKYGGDDETRAKWDSFQPTTTGRVPVTIRSLLRQAAASGWDDKRVKETCFNLLVRWMEEVSTMTELLEKGVQKILATPLLSAVQEDILVHQLCTQAKKRFAYTISTTAIRKDLARTKAEIKAQEKPAAEKMREPLWAKGVCYIAAAGDFYRHRTGEKYKPDSFNATYSRWLLPSEDALKDAGIPVTPSALSKAIVAPTDYALNHIKIPAVYDYAYDPSQPTEMFFVNRGRKYVNTYSPTYPELDPKRSAEAGALFQRHLVNLVAEPEYRRTLIDFCAFMVQAPGQKIRWGILIQGVDGCGKTYIAEAMKAVLGVEHVQTIDGAAIKQGWNDWAFGHQLVVLEEVRVAGTNRHEIMNALKPLITNNDISLNERFRNSRQADNITNYILFSNHHDALALTPGDRRYFVIKSPMQHTGQVKALGENYFPPLYDMLREMPGALRSWLMEWEISPDFRADGHAPRTKYVQDLINDSASDLTSAVRRLMVEGDYPLIQFDIVSAKSVMDVLHLEEGLTRTTAQQLAQVLREEGLHQVGRHAFGTERHYIWARAGVNPNTAIDTAADRLRRDLKNLCMELLF